MAAAQKSTTVRTVRSLLRALAAVSPTSAADLATTLFFRAPPRRRPRRIEEHVLASAERFTVADGLAAWRWGEGPTVLLVHGWGGSAGQLHALVEPLRRAGRSVVAFDLPAHGRSPGTSTSIPEVGDVLTVVASEVGPLAGVVAHSLGGASTLVALDRGLVTERVALVGAPAHPRDWFDGWVGDIVDGPALVAARERVEAKLGVRFDALEGATLAARRREPALIVHDRNDKEVPFEEGVEIAEAWPEATLLETTGLGHRRILDDARVARRLTDFLAGVPSALPVGCPHTDGDLPCEGCALSCELAAPDLRWTA